MMLHVTCNRLVGGSVRNCHCRLPEGGWLECPPEARGILTPVALPALSPVIPVSNSGDLCGDCGGARMIRTGTCLTCLDCGSTSGGCA